jgi:hypothetical protein
MAVIMTGSKAEGRTGRLETSLDGTSANANGASRLSHPSTVVGKYLLRTGNHAAQQTREPPAEQE